MKYFAYILSALCSLHFSGIASSQETANYPFAGVTAKSAEQVIHYPASWMPYKPRPEMKGKRLGVISHLFIKEGMGDQALREFRKVIDIVLKEPTCLVLKAERSLNDPRHFILYEEWEDYDDFFTVQLKRPYRPDFAKLLGPLAAKPAGPEFFQVYHDATIPKKETTKSKSEQKFAVIPSSYIDNLEKDELVKKAFSNLIDEVAKEPTNWILNAQQSINDPKHFILYQEWTDYEHFINVEMKKENREEFSSMIKASGARDPNNPNPIKPKMEFFEIIYDPGKSTL